MAKRLLLLHAPHVVPKFCSCGISLVSASALYRRPLLVNLQSSHIGLRLGSPYNRGFSARAFDDSSASSSVELEKEEKEERRDGVTRGRDEDYPTGEMEYENRNAWESFVVKLRMLFAFPWQRIRKGSVLTITLRGQISDQLKTRFTSELCLPQLSENFEKAAYDPRIAGIYLHIEPLSCGWGKVEEIRRHILDFKKSGKFIVGYINICGLKEYYLGCACNELYAPPSAYSFLYGLTVQASFLGGVFEKVGIEPQVQRIGKFKSAGDQLARKSISEENYEMLSVLLDNIYANWLDVVSESIGKKREDVESFINQGVYKIEKLKEEGLIKDILYDDEVISMLKERLGVKKDKKLPTVNYKKYSGVSKSTVGLSEGGDKIAIIRAGGSISRVKGPISTPGSSIIAEQLIEKFRIVRESKKYKAAIIRIDSPGGDALASDLLWREIKLLAETKPVIASMSDVAASGGYYMAMAANAIVAENLTLTGSIGVVTTRFTLAKLYEKIGFNKETISRGKYAELFGAEEKPFKPEDAELFGKSAQHAYQLFRDKAALSRSMPVDKMEEVAQGRVWTGKDAHARGLVDAIGGLSRAIAIAKQKANIPHDKKVNIVELSRPKTTLADIITSSVGSNVIGVDRTLKELLNELAITEGVQARMDEIVFQQIGLDSLGNPIIDLLKDYLNSLR